MIVHRMKQGSQDWLDARLGIPTASHFDEILTPGGKPSRSAEGYLNALVAERLLGVPCSSDADNDWMERGVALEDEARKWYAFHTGADPERVGFVTTDDGSIGCSPDALVGSDGLLEIKCPSAKVHVSYLRGNVAESYRPQIQGQLWVAERRWVDVLSYCPGFPPPLNAALVRVVRDESYVGSLEPAVRTLARLVGEEHARLAAVIEQAGAA